MIKKVQSPKVYDPPKMVSYDRMPNNISTLEKRTPPLINTLKEPISQPKIASPEKVFSIASSTYQGNQQ